MDAFLRLNSLVKHDDLALSQCQMFMHIGAFVLATLAVAFEMASFLCIYYKNTRSLNFNWWTNFLFVESEIYFFLTFLSMIPLLFILNSLLDKGISERKSD